jgi:HNH endonuclease
MTCRLARPTIHHIEHWADGGETKLSNLVTLCRLHHRLVHEGEVTVEPQAGGGWRFLHPDGRQFDLVHYEHDAGYEWVDLARTHADLGIHIDSNTAATRWRGERMDYDLAVRVLCRQAERADNVPDVSAETC